MVKVELERYEVIRIINLLNADTKENQDLLNDERITDFDNMLKEGIEENSVIINRLKKSLEV